jgi:hypothetical protein
MSTYYLHLDGGPDGCDYTISCNETVRVFEANNFEEALVKATKIVSEYRGENRILDAVLIEAAKIEKLNCAAIYERIDIRKAEKKAAEELEAKKKLFAKLKKELGK